MELGICFNQVRHTNSEMTVMKQDPSQIPRKGVQHTMRGPHGEAPGWPEGRGRGEIMGERPVPRHSSSPWHLEWVGQGDSILECWSPVEEVVGDVGSELLGLHLKSTLKGQSFISTLANPGRGSPSKPGRTQVSEHQNTEKKTWSIQSYNGAKMCSSRALTTSSETLVY